MCTSISNPSSDRCAQLAKILQVHPFEPMLMRELTDAMLRTDVVDPMLSTESTDPADSTLNADRQLHSAQQLTQLPNASRLR